MTSLAYMVDWINQKMNKEQMKEWLLVYDEKIIIDVHTPNEIFEDLSNMDFKSWKHKCFAYSYYYLSDFIYRNILYGEVHPEQFSQENIILSLISHKNTVSYITKEKGILEKAGYLKSTTNYPISFYKDENDMFDFSYINSLDKSMAYKTNSRFSIREPIKSLDRFEEDYSGTYYSKQNTHLVTISRFIDIISNPNLGYVGLYVYAFLSMMNDRYPTGYQISNKALSEVIGCNERTVSKYTKLLEELGYVKSERKLLEYKLLEKKYRTIDINDYRKRAK